MRDQKPSRRRSRRSRSRSSAVYVPKTPCPVRNSSSLARVAKPSSRRSSTRPRCPCRNSSSASASSTRRSASSPVPRRRARSAGMRTVISVKAAGVLSSMFCSYHAAESRSTISRYGHQAERAGDMRQSPVYVLNHSQHNFRQRTTQADLEEIEDWSDRAARRMYEGAGLGPKDVDIFNPYDGYAPMAQFFLVDFQWHGVKRGDAFQFYAGDIRVEGPHPFCSSGGNLGNGRTRTAMYTDSIEQLRGTAGARQVKVRAETALAAFTTPSSGGWIMFGKSPS